MVPAVAGDLVAGLGDAADQRRDGAAATQPRVKKVALTPGLVEQGEHAVGVALDAARERLPRVAGDHLLEGADLEPVLDIDGEGVLHRPSCSGRVGAVGRFLAVFRPSRRAGSGRGAASPPAPRRAPRARRCGARARDRAHGRCAARRGSSAATGPEPGGAERQHLLLARAARAPTASAPMSAATASTASASIVSAPSTAACEQHAGGELVDPARNAAAVAVDRLEGVGLEIGIALPVDPGQAVADIGARPRPRPSRRDGGWR